MPYVHQYYCMHLLDGVFFAVYILFLVVFFFINLTEYNFEVLTKQLLKEKHEICFRRNKSLIGP